MSELHKFLFEGLPVRGGIVRLTDGWREILRRRASNGTAGAYPAPLREMLGEMLAAATLMHSSIKFEGALVMQIFGDGPVKLAVVEVQTDLAFRATAAIVGTVAGDATLSQMVNAASKGRCAITLEPRRQLPGQQPYQSVVPLLDGQGCKIERLSAVLEHYMLQSEQLDTTLVLAANEEVAAGLLVQRMPMQGSGNLAASRGSSATAEPMELTEHYDRIAALASSLQRDELLTLDVEAILRRLFWQEQLSWFTPLQGESAPRFACNCGRERVGKMIVSLGLAEAQSILAEHGDIEVSCEFCGVQYRFDAVDAAQLFTARVQLVTAGQVPH